MLVAVGMDKAPNTYAALTDKQLITLVLDDGNEEALLYLIYERYERKLKYYAFRYYDSLEYYEDLCNELYLHLKGKDGDWSVLRSFQWRSSFATWFSLVASHLFWKKRDELIGREDDFCSNREGEGEQQIPEPPAEPENEQRVMLLEAINRLEDEVHRLIIIKELEGYNHKEIAEMIVEKRKREGRETYYGGELVVPNARYVDMNKHRALEEIKVHVEQIRKEWYGNK